MRYYWVKTHWIVRRIFRKYVWRIRGDKCVYLTFDDGPTPEITPWVLDELDKHGAKATFFCIGNNIRQNREIFDETVARGHSVGNHTFNHLNGWHVANDAYFEDVLKCEEQLHGHNQSRLFRPPYGKLRKNQFKFLQSKGYSVIMWDILTADFDHSITPEKCLQNVLRNVTSGSIIIFHDSEKAARNMRHALPQTLEFLKRNGFEMKRIDQICS